MMRGDCLVRTPVRPWSPTLLNCNKELHDSGISPGRSSSSGGPSTSPQSPNGPGGSPDSSDPFPHSPTGSRTYRIPNSHSPTDTYHHNSDTSQENENFRQNSYLGSPGAPFSSNGFPAFPDISSVNHGEPADNSLERLKIALERSSALAGIYKSESELREDGQDSPAKKEFPCPLCAYTTPYRHRYMEHVSTHYSDKCTICDFKGESAVELRSHLAEAHGASGGDLADLADPTDQPDHPSDGPEDEDGGRRGKPKNFKCKQCAFTTTTKVDFWEHNKTHIKAEKLLTCPKCPFVTEYKHHLEYHLRNHFGSKPFKCTKCSYSCVNKSMLNSHLKSHSNVYQYRCADCAYATKYCHSLKLHLRKYDHNPAMVLNQDGSPNPLPIIDVYGTRRGPKTKPKTENSLRTDLPGGVAVPTPPQDMDHLPPKLMGCNFCEFYTGSLDILNQHMFTHAAESPFSQMFRTNNNMPDQGAIKDYLQSMFLSMETPPSPMSLISSHHSPIYEPASPLDLSKAEETKDNQRNERKNRRKGKAYKLERPTIIETHENDDEPISMVKRELSPEVPMEVSDIKAENGKTNGHNSPPISPKPFELVEATLGEPDYKIKIPCWKGKDSDVDESSNSGDKSDSDGYTCHFCDMAFKDVVMYTMHMGYHGYRNPFTCNMCGHETTNRVAFFLHIARQSHS